MPSYMGPSAAVVSLGKKLYSHCLSHPAVKPGTYLPGHLPGNHKVPGSMPNWVFRAQLKSSSIADAVIPVEKFEKKKNLPSSSKEE